MLRPVPEDVYSARDIAQAAGVSEVRVQQALARGEIRSIAAQLPVVTDAELACFVAHDEAVRAVRALKGGNTVAVAGALGLGRELFAEGLRAERSTTVPLIVSTSLHAVAIAAILFVASLGFAVADERTEPLKDPEPIRMVFLVSPGPGKRLRLERHARASRRSAARCPRASFLRRPSRLQNHRSRRNRSTRSPCLRRCRPSVQSRKTRTA
jgi:hypothetical protein